MLAGCGKDEYYKLNIEYCNKLKNDYYADIMIWNCDSVKFLKEFAYREIDDISEQTLTKTGNAGYGCVVIIDRNGSCELTKEKTELLKKFSESNHYDIFYYGTKNLDVFVETKCIKEIYETDRGFFYIVSDSEIMEYNEAGNPHAAHGLWTDEEEKMASESSGFLQHSLLSELAYFAKKAEAFNTNR